MNYTKPATINSELKGALEDDKYFLLKVLLPAIFGLLVIVITITNIILISTCSHGKVVSILGQISSSFTGIMAVTVFVIAIIEILKRQRRKKKELQEMIVKMSG